MNKVLYIILISLFSLTIFSCAKDTDEDETTPTTTTTTKSYVSVGDSGTLLTSSDGTSWTSRTSGSSENLWNIYYENSTFVSVGGSGIILTSTDGTTWTSQGLLVQTSISIESLLETVPSL